LLPYTVKFKEKVSYIRRVAEKFRKPNTGVRKDYSAHPCYQTDNLVFVPNINIRALLSKVIRIFFALHSASLLRFVISLRISRHFFIQSGLAELKPISTNHKRYTAVCDSYLHLVRAVIGHSDKFLLGVLTLSRKPLFVRPIILIFLSMVCSLGFVCSFVLSFVRSSVHFLIRSSFRSMTSSRSYTQSVHTCVPFYLFSFVRLCVHLCICAFVRSFVGSFTASLFN